MMGFTPVNSPHYTMLSREDISKTICNFQNIIKVLKCEKQLKIKNLLYYGIYVWENTRKNNLEKQELI